MLPVLSLGLPDLGRLTRLKQQAEDTPYDVRPVLAQITTPKGLELHYRMLAPYVVEAAGHTVCYTIEQGHPVGTCRHLSVAVVPRRAPSGAIYRQLRPPSLEVVWAFARVFGFTGGLIACERWPETTPDQRIAMNIVQPLRPPPFNAMEAFTGILIPKL